MNISHHHCVGNSTKLLADHGTNQSKYLDPDYFLPASQRTSYYSKKYGRSIGRISRIVSVSLLSAMMLTVTLDAKAQPAIEPNQSFLFGKDSAGISTNVSSPPIMPQSPPPAPPIPPVLPAIPNLVSDTSIGGKSENRSALFESIRNFGKNILKKVKKEPKPKVLTSDGGDLMSQLYDTLERRRNGIAGGKNGAKSKKVVKQTPKLTSEEQARKKAENLARAATIREQNKKKWEEAAKKNEEIARERRRAEAEAVKARIEQKAKERGESREGVVNGIDPALHHNIVSDLRSEIAILREKLKNQGINNLAGTLGGGGGAEEPIYSKPIDTISMASSVTEYSEPWQDPDTEIGEAFETEFSTPNTQKQFEPSAPPLSSFSSSEDLHISEADSLGEEEAKVIKMLDEAIEDSGYSGSICSSVGDWSEEDSILDTDGYDTVYTSSSSKNSNDDNSEWETDFSDDSSDEDGIPFSPPATEEKKAELDIIREFQVSELSSAVASNDSINEANSLICSNIKKRCYEQQDVRY